MVAQLMQAIAEIPPIAFLDYPVDIQIRIYREGARYGADLIALGRSPRVPIEMSPKDLEALNERLQEKMKAIAEEIAEEPQSAELEAPLRSLAEVGNYAFRQVFGHRDTQAAIQELTALSGKVSIQITSEDFFLPWELLYPISLNEPLAYEHFWGMNYIISRVIVQETRPGDFVAPAIPIVHLPKLGLLTYGGLPSVEKKELPFFEKLADDGKIALFKLRPLDPENKLEEFKEFRSFWEEALNLAHFACHACYVDGSPDRTCILFM